jgi:hypothetical protein
VAAAAASPADNAPSTQNSSIGVSGSRGARHSMTAVCRLGIVTRRNGWTNPATPFGVASANRIAAQTKRPQCLAFDRPPPPVAGHNSASTPRNAASANPNINPACRLAHTAMIGKSQKVGMRLSSRAAINSPHQTTISGSARMCGRARRCGTTSPSEEIARTSGTNGSPRRSRKRINNAIAAAKPSAVIRRTPLQPANPKAPASAISASHSCGTHDALARLCENGS